MCACVAFPTYLLTATQQSRLRGDKEGGGSAASEVIGKGECVPPARVQLHR